MVDTVYVVIEQKTRSQRIPNSKTLAVFQKEDAAVTFIETTRNDYDGKLEYHEVDFLRDFTPVEEQDF
jgi:hypothetical protein